MMHPDLVILAYGTNEVNIDLSLSSYKQALINQVTRIRLTVPRSAIMLLGSGSSEMHKDAASCDSRRY